MPISSGIMFLMYRFGRLVALVYIRQPLRHHRTEAKRRPRQSRRPSAAKRIIKAEVTKDIGPVAVLLVVLDDALAYYYALLLFTLEHDRERLRHLRRQLLSQQLHNPPLTKSLS